MSIDSGFCEYQNKTSILRPLGKSLKVPEIFIFDKTTKEMPEYGVFSGPYFSLLHRKSHYSVWILENTEQKKVRI